MTRGLRGAQALGESVPLDAVAEASAADWAGLGSRVAQARRRGGLTGVELAERVGLAKDQISKIENGVRQLNVRELPHFAEALGTSVAHLLGQATQPHLAMAHRLCGDAPEGQELGTRQRAMRLLALEDVLAGRVSPPASSALGAQICTRVCREFATRPRNKAEAERQGRHIAEMVRGEFRLGSLEIGDLPGLLERTFGLDVALSPLGTETDGLYVHGEGVALVVASSSFSQGHVRFTLAHELGHHLCSDGRDVIAEDSADMFADDLLEKRVNAFASHFLMPADGVRETVQWAGQGQVSERVLVALMDRFGVSLRALLWQLQTLRLVSFEGAVRMRTLPVNALVDRHRELAPNGGCAKVVESVRAPERLVGTAVRAAQAQQVGLSVVAALLERPDDDDLWDEIMGTVDDLAGDDAQVTSPAR